MAAPHVHVASTIEDTVHSVVERGLRRAGWKPWLVPFTGYGLAGSWVRVLARVLLEPAHQIGPRGDARGWRRFVAHSAAEIPVRIEVGGTTRTVRTNREGYVDVRVPVDLGPGWATAVLTAGDGRAVRAPLRVVDPASTAGIISDVDDTVMVTMLPRPLRAFRNAFLRQEGARRPVPTMARLYAALLAAEPDTFVVYLSTGAWNVAPALTAFLARHRYPAGPLLLTHWGPTPRGWFRDGQDHKRTELRRLLEDLPQVRWLLIGDDGQHDPSIYAELAAEHPGRVRAVLLRELSLTEQVSTHGGAGPLDDATIEMPVPVVRGPDGEALLAAARETGLLD